MMGERTVAQEALFYGFSVERHVPVDHLLRSIGRFVDLSGIREHMRPFYSETGRSSMDPELMIRMLIIGYCMGVWPERRLCEEVHLNLAYSWFCRLGLEGDVPDHSTFSKNRHGRLTAAPSPAAPRQRPPARVVRGDGRALHGRGAGRRRRGIQKGQRAACGILDVRQHDRSRTRRKTAGDRYCVPGIAEPWVSPEPWCPRNLAVSPEPVQDLYEAKFMKFTVWRGSLKRAFRHEIGACAAWPRRRFDGSKSGRGTRVQRPCPTRGV